jgi:hypothetical protein
MKSIATLVGTTLYVDGRPWSYDVTPDMAVKIVYDMRDEPNAPTQVVFDVMRSHRKPIGLGWPSA